MHSSSLAHACDAQILPSSVGAPLPVLCCGWLAGLAVRTGCLPHQARSAPCCKFLKRVCTAAREGAGERAGREHSVAPALGWSDRDLTLPQLMRSQLRSDCQISLSVICQSTDVICKWQEQPQSAWFLLCMGFTFPCFSSFQ